MSVARLTVTIKNAPSGVSLGALRDKIHLQDITERLFLIWDGDTFGPRLSPVSHFVHPDRLEFLLDVDCPVVCQIMLIAPRGYGALDWAVLEPGIPAQVALSWENQTLIPPTSDEDFEESFRKLDIQRARQSHMLFENIGKLNRYAAVRGFIPRESGQDSIPARIDAKRSDALTIELNADVPIVIHTSLQVGVDWCVIPIPPGRWDFTISNYLGWKWKQQIQLRTGEICDLGSIELLGDN